MGTHCAMIVRDTTGKITRYERTLDGNLLADEFYCWIDTQGTPNQYEHPDPEQIGHGDLEVNEDCEFEAEFELHLDLRGKTFWFSWAIGGQAEFDKVVRLNKLGWTIRYDSDLSYAFMIE